jgi:prepilin-type N-terminal cleavage/methylation domain-containing protein
MYLPTRPTRRRGLSLLEVLVALAIFLLSFVAIGKLVTLATDRAVDVQWQSEATRLAQSKLNEVICGAAPLQAASGTFEEDSEWEWSIDAEQDSDVPGLWIVSVTVTRTTGADEEPISSTLTQMVLDPSVRGSVFDTLTVTGSGDSAPSASTGGSSSPSGQQGQQAAGGAAAGGGTKAGGGNAKAPAGGNNAKAPGGGNNAKAPGGGNNARTPGGGNNKAPAGGNNNANTKGGGNNSANTKGGASKP